MKKSILVLFATLPMVGCVAPKASSPASASPSLPDYVLTNNFQRSAQFFKPVSALGGFQAVGQVVINGRQAVAQPIVINGQTIWLFTAQQVP